MLPYRFCEQKILKYNRNDKYKGKKIIRLQNFRGEKFEALKIYFQFPNFCSSNDTVERLLSNNSAIIVAITRRSWN